MFTKHTILLLGVIMMIQQGINSQPTNCPNLIYDCPGDPSRNILSFADIQKYVRTYRNHFQGKWKTHTRALYLNAESILFLERFFISNPHYLGVNIHFKAQNKFDATGQIDLNQFLFYFTPTMNISKPSPGYKVSDYLAFKNFYDTMAGQQNFPVAKINHGSVCPSYCDSTTSEVATTWGYKVQYSRLNIIGGGVGLFFSLDPTTQRSYKKRYKTQSGYDKKKHTRSTFIKAETLKLLAEYIRNSRGTYAAVAMYCLSYGAPMPGVSGSKWPYQIAVGFAPMVLCNGNYEPDFCGFTQFLQSLKISRPDKTFNHGELCPDDCPKDPDEGPF